jgi:Fibronectin type III domain
MNIKNHARHAVLALALAGSFATAVGATGAVRADGDVPQDSAATEVPPVPPAEDTPPGSDDGSTETPPAADDGTAAPSTDPETPPESTEPTELPPESTTPSDAIAEPPSDAIATVVAATAATAPQSPGTYAFNGNVKLTWLAPASDGGSAIDYYVVQRSMNGTSGWTDVGSPASTSFIVSGLSNGTKYYFRIAAHNGVGLGAFSAVVNAVPLTVPSAPMYPQANPNNTGAVMVTWQAPSNNGGATVDLYQVQRATSWIGPWTKVADVGVLGRLDDAPLKPGTTYFYRVAAHNAAGWGAYSYLVAAVPRTVPAIVPFCNAYQPIHGAKWISVKWQPPSSNGAPIEYYTIELWKNGAYYYSYKKEAYQVQGTVDVFSFGIYQVRVSAHNAAGDGPYCSQSVGVY